MDANINYCQQRLKELGIKDSDNQLSVIRNEGTEIRNFFTSDEKNNIVINYFAPNGFVEQYKNGHWSKEFKRIRLNPSLVKEAKYLSPSGSGSRFFWPKKLIEAYQAKQEINTLIITEGELKAFKACLHNIYCAGVPGIHNFKDKETGLFPSDFLSLLEVCKVQSIIFLHDADCISEKHISKALHKNNDLALRLASFYTSVKTFFQLSSSLGINVYYAHIKHKYETHAKGLDDLLCYFSGKENYIKEELEAHSKESNYFDFLKMDENYTAKLLEKFYLDLDLKIYPKAFYKRFKHILQDNEFIFHGSKFKYANDNLKLTFHPEISKFMRVRADYYKASYSLRPDGGYEFILAQWKKSEIPTDINFIPSRELFQIIPKYESFVNIPDNTSNYKRVHDNCYNLYEPLRHELKRGNFPVTEKFLKHIFKEYYEIALDYFTILYRFPNQKLPAICPVSKERNTGKTTFLRLLILIFQNNAIILSNTDFTEKFNSYLAGKLVIGIDETFIDKKNTAEHLKKLITDDFIMLHPKGKEAYKIPFFAKFVLNSNNVNDFLMIDPEENRYFILEIDPIKKDEEIPNIEKELQKELPYFIEFIHNREITHPHKTRFWFDYDLYKTPALKKVVSHSKSKLEQAMTEWFDSIFNHVDMVQNDYIECTPKLLECELHERFNKYNDLQGEIRKVLKYKWNLSPEPMKKFKFYNVTEIAESDNSFIQQLYTSTRTGTPYKVTRELIQSLL